MKKLLILAMTLLMIAGVMLVAGCGDNTETEAASKAAVEGEVQVATHDCDGGCGMTDVPMEKLTEIDGKFYCAGCAAKMKTDEHAGHDHD